MNGPPAGSVSPVPVVPMAHRIFRRALQALSAIVLSVLLMTFAGTAVVGKSFDQLAARQEFLSDQGVEHLIDASHFAQRTFGQNLAAGAFFGVTLGVGIGLVIFILSVLVEALPWRSVRITAGVALCLLLTYLSIVIVGAAGAFFWAAVLPTAVLCISEAVSPTPLWRRNEPERRRAEPPVPSPGPDSRCRRALVLLALNGATIIALAIWLMQISPILRAYGENEGSFFYFRDDFLLSTSHGRALDRFYYRHSPYAAEYFRPTHFQPVTVVSVGLGEEDMDQRIPSAYGPSLIPVYRFHAQNIEDALRGLSSGVYDVAVLRPAGENQTPEAIEESISGLDPPTDWRSRCIVVADRSRRELPVRTAGTFETRIAVARAIKGMTDRSPAGTLRDAVSLGFLAPLQNILAGPLLPALVILVALCGAPIVIAVTTDRKSRYYMVLTISTLLTVIVSYTLIAGGRERTALAGAMGRLHSDKSVSEATMEELLSAPSPAGRYPALRHMAERPRPGLTRRALELMDDPDVRVRMWATCAVGVDLKVKAAAAKNSSPTDSVTRLRALPLLLVALRDDSFHVRYKAAEALGAARFTEAQPALLELIERNEHLYVTWYAVKAVRRLRLQRTEKK